MDDISYILNQLGEERENYFNAVSAPLIQTSNFAFKTVEDYQQAMQSEKDNSLYTRGINPTVKILCRKLAALEETEDCLVFASGMAAISAAVISQVKSGDHIICIENAYGWTNALLADFLNRFGVEFTFVDGKKTENFRNAIKSNTKVIYLESPNSLLFEMQDIPAVCKLAKEHQIVTIIDNSYAGPLSNSTSQMGVDIVLHSASKYINGHSDVVAGVLCTSRKIAEQIFYHEYMTLGGIIGPLDAWLMIRSLRTLPMRMERTSNSAQRVIDYLKTHPKIKQIHYPFLPDFPQKHLVASHMPKPMAMFSIVLDSEDVTKIKAFCNSLNYFLLAPSWGGHESLIFPTCVFKSDDSRSSLPVNIVRMYIGFEEADTLIADLKQALNKL
ncbi:MAG: PLP-dependent transferase [Calditrichaeota bacterium]|nr:PLP-dependent transferase [Calditrichota bacterium]